MTVVYIYVNAPRSPLTASALLLIESNREIQCAFVLAGVARLFVFSFFPSIFVCVFCRPSIWLNMFIAFVLAHSLPTHKVRHKILLFSLSICPHCSPLLQLFGTFGEQYYIPRDSHSLEMSIEHSTNKKKKKMKNTDTRTKQIEKREAWATILN